MVSRDGKNAHRSKQCTSREPPEFLPLVNQLLVPVQGDNITVAEATLLKQAPGTKDLVVGNSLNMY